MAKNKTSKPKPGKTAGKKALSPKPTAKAKPKRTPKAPPAPAPAQEPSIEQPIEPADAETPEQPSRRRRKSQPGYAIGEALRDILDLKDKQVDKVCQDLRDVLERSRKA